MKYDDDIKEKPPIHLIPTEVLRSVATVLGFGAKKYAEHNWRDDLNVTAQSRTYSSIQRHLFAWLEGQDIDPDSGLHHIDHAITQAIILKMSILYAPEMDDRYTTTRGKDV
jgi:hypothetical protein